MGISKPVVFILEIMHHQTLFRYPQFYEIMSDFNKVVSAAKQRQLQPLLVRDSPLDDDDVVSQDSQDEQMVSMRPVSASVPVPETASTSATLTAPPETEPEETEFASEVAMDVNISESTKRPFVATPNLPRGKHSSTS